MVSHPVILRGLAGNSRAGAMILHRTDEDFVEKTLEECREPALAELRRHLAQKRDRAGVLALYQPVHHAFHLALFEVVCDRTGHPRLSPDDLAGAGMVIRRVASSRPAGAFGEAWLHDRGVCHGWVPFRASAATRLDPDPKRRKLADQGHALINARVREAVHGADVAEDVITLHVLPPDVCAAAGRTVLFGLIPTVSAETAAPGVNQDAPYSADEVSSSVPPFLRAGKPPTLSAIGGVTFTYESAELLAQAGRATDHPSESAKQMMAFVDMLRVLMIQLDAFGESQDAVRLRGKLASITLTFPNQVTETADTYLARAAEILVLQPGTGRTIQLPASWPQLSPNTAGSIRTAYATVLQARYASFAPRATRFDDPEARYRLHPFVRVRRDDGCPPELVWGEPSVPYRIMPWYESGDAPPVLVRLPPLDRRNLRKLKPNVAFVVPKGLWCLLNRNSPKDILENKGKECSASMMQGSMEWVCGFNIPIITICAFILLYIILNILHLIFWWLPWVKICYPLPRNATDLVPKELLP